MAAIEKAATALKGELRRFIRDHPAGWGHAEWADLLERLRGTGYDVSDEVRIGQALERERLAFLLGQVKNVGPQRMKMLVDRYETVWSLRHSGAEEIAGATRIPVAIARQIKESV